MNPLESLKNKLKIKPKVEPPKEIEIYVKQSQKVLDTTEKVDNKNLKQPSANINIIDESSNRGFDRKMFLNKLKENKILKVVEKDVNKKGEINEDQKIDTEVSVLEEIPKPKKIAKKLSFVIEEDEEPELLEKKKDALELEGEEEPEQMVEGQPQLIEEGQQREIGEPLKEVELVIDDEEVIEIIPKKTRKTRKVEKGIAVLDNDALVKLGNTSIASRLPEKQPPINIKVSGYYMNNRQIFVNFINSIFEPYRIELEENRENISCDNIGKGSSDNFSLLTHQKIVRDYINLYTPYRGLLLYHGLGSGKTASSIAIAEGMKDSKRIIVMTPASLRRNYIEELKKAGDLLYKKNQYWEWISIASNPEMLKTLSVVLNLPLEYIRKNKGAWLVNIKKKSNYVTLSSEQKKSLDDQLDNMIQSKYTFINYNGLRNRRLGELTNNYTMNLFDNCVVIIDEAHNLISRIVNKIKKEKPAKENKKGEKETPPKDLSTKLYEYLLSAKNCRIVLLSGTPIINYPNEFGILFNILRGYIKTWEITLNVKTSKKVDKNYLQEILMGEKSMDYLDYSPSSKILTITRNPYGFKNKIKQETGYQGVNNTKRNDTGVEIFNTDEDYFSDDAFEKKIISILNKNDIETEYDGIRIKNNKALPDDFAIFQNEYIDEATGDIKNMDSLKRRIIGLSSYFRSAQEELLPRFDKSPADYHIIRIPMSDYQFKIYESARVEERKIEKQNKKKANMGVDLDGVYKESSSTYRIFSRLYCNFVNQDRPLPSEFRKKNENRENVENKLIDAIENILKEARKVEKDMDLTDEISGEIEGDEVLNMIGDTTYKNKIDELITQIKENSSEFLTPEKLEVYSPKFLHILENIQEKENMGLHLVYSQFRSLEGIELFSLVLEKNGFARFKIKKNNLDSWELDMSDKDIGKPTYALYTGTETAEEKEIIRNIYNGAWDYIPTNIADGLKKIANNNNMGEIIKVLMITSSGSEGINLRNTRFVHIMEPYWHPVRVEQVIGRARRICSHKDLPLPLQTVEVFVYLMVFTEAQLKGDDAIELKLRDKSKITGKPITSDEYLFEISSIKEKLTNQLTMAIKETSFDCAIYSKSTNIACVNFSNPTKDKFSFVPNYSKEQSDVTLKANLKKIEWEGKPINIEGVDYVYRAISPKVLNIYDLNSYKQALENPSINPILLGTLEINDRGQKVFKKIK